MPSLAQHKSQRFTKLLLLGDAKSGKTGSLVSLVKAGYKLRILDFDNLLDILAKLVAIQCPDKVDNVEFRSLYDKRKATEAGAVIDGTPKAFADALRMLDRWKYGDIDLGVPAKWGPGCILVIDSLSRFSDAAYDFREPLAVRGKGGEFDSRAVYYDAQIAIEDALGLITSDSFETNVIVICHGKYMELEDGTRKIFPQSIGSALSPQIPQYFPTFVRYKNMAGKRTMQLTSDPMIDLAVSDPSITEKHKTLPVETGLATLFELLRGPLTQEEMEDDGTRPAEGKHDSNGGAEHPGTPSEADPNPGTAPSTRKFQPITKFTRR
jgi:hypothetical protein